MTRNSPSMAALHRARTARQVAASPHGGTVTGSAYDLLCAQLAEHRRILKDIQSVERKIDAKRAFLPIYADWIATTLGSGQGAQDVVFTTLLMWHIDCGSLATAMEMAKYAIKHGLTLPDQFERSLPAAVQEEVAIAYLGARWPADLPAAPVLEQLIALTDNADVHDQIRSKLHKAAGYALASKVGQVDINIEQLDPDTMRQAAGHLRRALELHDQAGCKKDLERLERALRARS